MEFFTNNQKTADEKVDVTSPAFSITKVQATLGVIIAAIVGTLPPALENKEAVYIAAIAAATLVVLGIFALAAVDIKVRQRAAESKLRFGGGEGLKGEFTALPAEENLVIQKGSNTDEFKVRMAAVKAEGVDLLATRDGKTITLSFEKPAAK
jgi:hypothetical protein